MSTNRTARQWDFIRRWGLPFADAQRPTILAGLIRYCIYVMKGTRTKQLNNIRRSVRYGRFFIIVQTQKSPSVRMGFFTCLMPGSSLLSHGETPHYHRRYGVSLLSSAWGQVGPPRYGRQANSVLLTRLSPVNLICIRLKIFSHPPKHLRRCKVKPHGSLVSVSSTHRCAYTPDLSTS